MRKFIIVILMFFGTNIFADGFVSSNQLLIWCEKYLKYDSYNTYRSFQCIGYIEGYTDSILYLIDNSKNEICFRNNLNGVTTDQLARMTVKFLSNNPRLLNLSAAESLGLILTKNFYCKK